MSQASPLPHPIATGHIGDMLLVEPNQHDNHPTTIERVTARNLDAHLISGDARYRDSHAALFQIARSFDIGRNLLLPVPRSMQLAVHNHLRGIDIR